MFGDGTEPGARESIGGIEGGGGVDSFGKKGAKKKVKEIITLGDGLFLMEKRT